jgi:endonuclease/exonuclease/phosphatase family metal-dependent hydrolase
LNVLTFNAGLLEVKLLGIPILKTTKYIEERLREIPRALIETNADVIALQEVYFRKHQEYILQNVREHYPYHACHQTRLGKPDNGLMILTKYPIFSYEFYPSKISGSFEERFVLQKGVLAVEVVLSEKVKVLILNVHPTSGGMGDKQESENAHTARGFQIRQALDIFATKENDNTIILGDFNAGPELDKLSYEILSEKGFVDVFLLYCKNNNLQPKPTWDKQNILIMEGTHSHTSSQRIDHIFISEKLIKNVSLNKVFRTLDQPQIEIDGKEISLSDHYAIQAILEF